MNRQILISGILLSLSVFLATGCAGRFYHIDFAKKMYARYDTNGNGYVDKKEYLNLSLKRFNRSDRNKDGKITKKEIENNRFAKIMPNFVDNYFKRNDLNHDGIVKKQELIKQTNQDFIKADKNKDNKLTLSEIENFRMQMRFNYLDTNKDGLISKDEFKKSNYYLKNTKDKK